jgi:hypothetical protein
MSNKFTLRTPVEVGMMQRPFGPGLEEYLWQLAAMLDFVLFLAVLFFELMTGGALEGLVVVEPPAAVVILEVQQVVMVANFVHLPQLQVVEKKEEPDFHLGQ